MKRRTAMENFLKSILYIDRGAYSGEVKGGVAAFKMCKIE